MKFLLAALLCWAGIAEARDVMDLRTYGAPSANTIYLFTSPGCSHCRDFHKTIFPEILKRFVNNKKAELVIVDMPAALNSLQATMLMRCLPADKSLKAMGWIYENQSQWAYTENVKGIFEKYAQALGMSKSDFEKCLANEKLQQNILNQRNQWATLYKIGGTPTTVLRHGNTVKYYVGTDRQDVLGGLTRDIQEFEKQGR